MGEILSNMLHDPENMIAVLVVNLCRHPEGNSNARIQALYDLCSEVKEESWITWLKHNKDEILINPRYFITWPGPFKEVEFTELTVGPILYEKYKDIIK